MTLKAFVTLVNEDEGYQFADWSEDLDEDLTLGGLFRLSQQEWGRCTSKVYVGDRQQVGWCFEKRERYSDSSDTYLQSAWVTIGELVEEAKPAQYRSPWQLAS